MAAAADVDSTGDDDFSVCGQLLSLVTDTRRHSLM